MFDLAILQLGEDNHALPSTATYSLQNPKRARSSVERQDIYDLANCANDADGESDARFEEPLPKKRRRSRRRVLRVGAQNSALEG